MSDMRTSKAGSSGTTTGPSSGQPTLHASGNPAPTPNVSEPSSVCGFRRAAGLVLLLTAAWAGTMNPGTWDAWVAWAKTLCSPSAVQVWVDEPADRPGVPAGGSAEAVAEQEPAPWRWIIERQVAWVWVVLTAALLLVAMWCVPAVRSSYAVIAALVGLVGWCSVELLDIAASWQHLVLAATGLGYLVHLAAQQAKISPLGVLGLTLVMLAGFGATRGWYDWASVASRLASAPAEFAATWGEKLTWATVLVLTFIGVLCSRTKPVHFLIALLLLAVAYHCVVAGSVETRAFPELSKPGGAIVTEEDESFANVEAWRWVVAVELIVISAVLLYKAMGVGSLNVAFALAWMLLGCYFYGSIRTASLARLWGDMGTISGKMADSGSDRRGTSSLSPLTNWGLPLKAAGPPGQPGRSDAGRSQPRGRTDRTTTMPATRPNRRTATSGPTDEQLARAMAAAQESVRQAEWREVALPLWIYLTAVLAGIIATAGLAMLVPAEGGRAWLGYGLWLVFGAALAATWFADPKEPGQSWLSWISDWTQSRFKLHVVWLIFSGTVAVAGSWALRPRSDAESWIRASIGCIFAGTALTLVGVTVLDRYGGFQTLPIWTYAAIAGGQSSLMWVLGLYISLLERRREAGARSVAGGA